MSPFILMETPMNAPVFSWTGAFSVERFDHL